MTPEIALWGLIGFVLGRVGIELWFHFDPFRDRTRWSRLCDSHFREIYSSPMLNDDVHRVTG